MTQAIKPSHIFDYIIYGSDLTTQIIATCLSLENNNILHIEKPLSLGQFIKHPDEEDPTSEYLDSNFQSCPKGRSAEEMLGWLEQLVGEKVIDRITSNPAITFDSGEFKNLMGFQDRKFLSIKPVSHYLSQEQFQLNSTPQKWQKIFKMAYEGQTLSQSQITSIEVGQAEVRSVTINAQKKILTKNLIYCAEPKDLLFYFEKEGLSKKNKQQLSKPKVFSKLIMSFNHNIDSKEFEKLSPKEGLHVLMGVKDDFEPTVGTFKNKTSTWVSFFEESQSESFEEVGALLKYMKRQIKRAYPTFFDSISCEKVSVAPSAHAHFEFQFNGIGQIDKLSNCWAFSPLFFDEFNLIGQLQAARSALKAFQLDSIENLQPSIPLKTPEIQA